MPYSSLCFIVVFFGIYTRFCFLSLSRLSFYWLLYTSVKWLQVIKWPRVHDQAPDFLPFLCRDSLRTRMGRNTSTRSQSSLLYRRFPRGSWSSTPTSLVRRTSRSFRTLAGWGHICMSLYNVTVNGRPWELCKGLGRTSCWWFVVQSSGTTFRKEQNNNSINGELNIRVTG